jgi:hypothetical protein
MAATLWHLVKPCDGDSINVNKPYIAGENVGRFSLEQQSVFNFSTNLMNPLNHTIVV